jgi:hypothetical protein
VADMPLVEVESSPAGPDVTTRFRRAVRHGKSGVFYSASVRSQRSAKPAVGERATKRSKAASGGERTCASRACAQFVGKDRQGRLCIYEILTESRGLFIRRSLNRRESLWHEKMHILDCGGRERGGDPQGIARA